MAQWKTKKRLKSRFKSKMRKIRLSVKMTLANIGLQPQNNEALSLAVHRVGEAFMLSDPSLPASKVFHWANVFVGTGFVDLFLYSDTPNIVWLGHKVFCDRTWLFTIKLTFLSQLVFKHLFKILLIECRNSLETDRTTPFLINTI